MISCLCFQWDHQEELVVGQAGVQQGAGHAGRPCPSAHYRVRATLTQNTHVPEVLCRSACMYTCYP